MGYRKTSFSPGEIYHIFTRGVEKRDIFLDQKDYSRFQELFHHCNPVTDILSFSTARRLKHEATITVIDTGLVNILGYSLMPNHFHFLLQENVDGGISKYMQRILNSYARYFNVKYKRQGALFVGPFRAVHVQSDEQLLHTSRYIDLNAYTAHITSNAFAYPWDSTLEHIDESTTNLCHTKLIQDILPYEQYKLLLLDHADYIASIEEYADIFIDS